MYYRIYALEDQWYSPSAQYFKVRADGKRFILRYDQADDEWTLQSAYIGNPVFMTRVEKFTIAGQNEPPTSRRVIPLRD